MNELNYQSRGVPQPGPNGEEVPQGTYPPPPDQVSMGGVVPQGTYAPQPGPNGGGGTQRYLPHGQGYPKVPTPPTRSQQGEEGVPQGTSSPPPPRIGQHMEYLMGCGRFASCIHAGGLSCSTCI